MVLDASTLRDNSAEDGGGLYNDAGSTTLLGSAVVGNIAADTDGGGGIYEGCPFVRAAFVSAPVSGPAVGTPSRPPSHPIGPGA